MAVWDVASRPEPDQFGYWHEVICRAFVPLTPRRTTPGAGFAARVETRTLHDVERALIASQPQETAHGPREVARTDGAFYFVNLQVEGHCRTRQGGTESVVGPGRFTIVDTTEPYWFDFDGPWRMVSYRLPHALLDARLGGARPQVGRCFEATGAGAVVASMLSTLWEVDGSTGPAATAELEQALASAVTATTAGRAVEDPRETLRAEILRDVRRRLGDPSLTVAGVCRRFGISARTLHATFAGAERPFAATVRRMRLECCAVLLADPVTPGTVTAIAASLGFDDPASFSRAFRREFGCTPSEVRDGASPRGMHS
ncbi:AraC family transcriptional regulator [Pseudonocardia sediminis]|uniref:AraC family transcriptional regulator n=1 Tax=Pseudonocardia sediminis TaxID=1397368 RepID=A0A4Q7UXW4_PSEST|nr:helix-turn-helix domain-containing protein [Pseudonocardia sediminis]RZT84989.1 AraC family transcriptional regulator [Pseudonocardia sediminis]